MFDLSESLDPGTITKLLGKIDSGDKLSRDELFDYIYEELKRIAHRHQSKELGRDLLQTTALVNEACLRLPTMVKCLVRKIDGTCLACLAELPNKF